MFRKYLAFPFILIGIPIFVVGVVIRFGLEDSCKVLEALNKTIHKIKGK